MREVPLHCEKWSQGGTLDALKHYCKEMGVHAASAAQPAVLVSCIVIMIMEM